MGRVLTCNLPSSSDLEWLWQDGIVTGRESGDPNKITKVSTQHGGCNVKNPSALTENKSPWLSSAHQRLHNWHICDVELSRGTRIADISSAAWGTQSTNIYVEYQGLCTGLVAAEKQSWAPLAVVDDSMMIIRQMTHRNCPKKPTLCVLYELARTAADALGVHDWRHHYRSHNKMADKAANQAMDGCASYLAHAEDKREELTELGEWLQNDTHRWLAAQDPLTNRETDRRS